MLFRLAGAACCAAALLAAPDVWAQTPSPGLLAPPPLNAVRDGLEAIPLPDGSSFESAVAAHLAEARESFTRAAADPRVSRRTLADAYGALGRVLHAYELFDAAEIAYHNALRLDPNDATWLHLLGYVYQQTGRLEAAAARFAAAARVAPSDHAAALRLGEAWLELGRLHDARAQFEALLSVFPAAARKGLGDVALREGRHGEALEQLRGALERAPQADALHYQIALAYRGLGRLEEARRHLQQRGVREIVAVDPIVDELAALVRGERLLVIRGTRAYAAGQFREAAEAFSRALEASPESVPARVNLAAAQMQLGDVPRAIEQLKAALVRAPGDLEVGRHLVTALLRVGRRDEAMGVLTSMHEANPDDEDAVVGLAILLADRERYADALVMLDDAHARFPARLQTATTLARLLASSPDLSRRDGGRALELAGQVYASDARATHAETVALALAELGRCDEAFGWMQRAVSAAESENDSGELERLRAEMPRYQSASCRAPGR